MMIPAGENRGAVYIFTKNADGMWVRDTKLAHGSNSLNINNDFAYFGESMAVSSDGNTLAVGAWYDEAGGPDRGAVYLFTKSGSTWQYSAKIASGVQEDFSLKDSDWFGASVALSSDGSVLASGAVGHGANGTYNSGAVHLFKKNGSTWRYSGKIDNYADGLSLSNEEWFGSATAFSSDGNTLFVGAYGNDTGGSNRGAIYIFTKNGTNWTKSAKIASGFDGLALSRGGKLGYKMALSSDGNTLFARAATSSGNFNLIHIFTGQGAVWKYVGEISDFTTDETAASDGYTYYIKSLAAASDGNTVYATYADPNTAHTGVVQILKPSIPISFLGPVDDQQYGADTPGP